jgi:hypothetical protein
MDLKSWMKLKTRLLDLYVSLYRCINFSLPSHIARSLTTWLCTSKTSFKVKTKLTHRRKKFLVVPKKSKCQNDCKQKWKEIETLFGNHSGFLFMIDCDLWLTCGTSWKPKSHISHCSKNRRPKNLVNKSSRRMYWVDGMCNVLLIRFINISGGREDFFRRAMFAKWYVPILSPHERA